MGHVLPALCNTSHSSSAWQDGSSCPSKGNWELMQCPQHSSVQRSPPQPAAPAHAALMANPGLHLPVGNGGCLVPECRGNAGHSPPQNRPCPAHGTGGKCFWSLAACEAKETGVRWERAGTEAQTTPVSWPARLQLAPKPLLKPTLLPCEASKAGAADGAKKGP